MKLLIAKYLGFCTGVNRAYNLAVKTAKNGEPVYMLGYLVHNQKVIDELKAVGVQTVKALKEIPKGASGYLIISAHGLPPDMHDKAQSVGLKIIDTTCPWVKKPQMLAKELVEEGYHLVIVGDKNHTEVVGIMGWAHNKAQVIESVKDIKKVDFHDKMAVIAQTTQSMKNFEDVVNGLAGKTNELKMFNTICEATSKMQRSAVDVAKRSEIMLVIGDGKSANTRRLKELCEETGAKTYQIESADDLDLNLLKGFEVIGLTAGASTPAYVIEEVIKKLRGS
ncbi:MAG: 4-hydroxy-3-methylbut-2-enyl diphosphate reductase [bacterium]